MQEDNGVIRQYETLIVDTLSKKAASTVRDKVFRRTLGLTVGSTMQVLSEASQDDFAETLDGVLAALAAAAALAIGLAKNGNGSLDPAEERFEAEFRKRVDSYGNNQSSVAPVNADASVSQGVDGR